MCQQYSTVPSQIVFHEMTLILYFPRCMKSHFRFNSTCFSFVTIAIFHAYAKFISPLSTYLPHNMAQSYLQNTYFHLRFISYS